MTHFFLRSLPKCLILFGALSALLLLLSITGKIAYANPPGFDQCANSSSGGTTCSQGWINGNLGDNKAKYFEGDSVPQRITFSGLDPNTTYTITFGWDIINSGAHAYDFLTSYNRTITGADACTGTGAACGTVNTLAIPNDSYLNACATGQVSPQAYFGPYPPLAGQVFTFFGDVVNTVSNPLSASAYSQTTCPTASGTVQNTITLTFRTGATGGSVVLAYATHVATSGNWGSGNSAANISGSSYHNSLIACSNNISGCGQRDNQMATNAVAPAPAFATQIRLQATNAPVPAPYDSIATGTQFYDSATISGISASGGVGGTINGTLAFFMCGPTVTVTPCTTGGTSVAVQGGSSISVTPPTVGSFRTVATSAPTTGIYCFRMEFTSTGTNYSNFQATSTSGECVFALNPTASRLTSFSADARARYILLEWTSGAETDVLGFNVLRSTTRKGSYVPLNANPIPALHLGEPRGDDYQYKDKTAADGVKYFYKIEVLGAAGILERSDLVKVRKPVRQ